MGFTFERVAQKRFQEITPRTMRLTEVQADRRRIQPRKMCPCLRGVGARSGRSATFLGLAREGPATTRAENMPFVLWGPFLEIVPPTTQQEINVWGEALVLGEGSQDYKRRGIKGDRAEPSESCEGPLASNSAKCCLPLYSLCNLCREGRRWRRQLSQNIPRQRLSAESFSRQTRRIYSKPQSARPPRV